MLACITVHAGMAATVREGFDILDINHEKLFHNMNNAKIKINLYYIESFDRCCLHEENPKTDGFGV